MGNAHGKLPSEKVMKQFCHETTNKWLPLQAFSLLIPLTIVFLAFCSVIAVCTVCFSAARGDGFGSAAGWLEWLQSSLMYSVASAGALVALAVFVNVYLRTHFGAPAYFCEMQADLSRESVMRLSREYLRENALDEYLREDTEKGRIIAKIAERNYSVTYLEVTTVPLDNDSTWIVVRTASVVCGRAALLSSFFNDFGASREAAARMIAVFHSFSSSKRRRVQGQRSSQQAIPRLQPINACPPPTTSRPGTHVHIPSAGWRRAAQIMHGR